MLRCLFPKRSLFALAGLLSLGLAPAQAQDVLTIYTTREPGLMEPLVEMFEKETGVDVQTVFMKDGLGERVAAEGKLSKADLLMAVDVGNLTDLVEKGVTQPIRSEALDAAVPQQLRDAEGRWFALSQRARVLYASKERVSEKEISYEQLAQPEWKGRLCIRSGQHPYNIALIAAFLAHHGEAKTEAWLRGLKANLARKAAGGDRDVARDILGGICDAGLANSYYVGAMRSGKGGEEQKKWGEAIRVLLPKFENGATHVNVSGAGVAKYAPNRDLAVTFLEFLTSDKGQELYAQANYEYPVKPGVAVSPLIAELGALTPDSMSLSEIAKHRKKASELVDKVGFDI